MKQFIALAVILCVIAAAAQSLVPNRRKNFQPAALSAIATCNTWQDFEFAASAGGVTASNLLAHDHNGTNSWTVQDTSSEMSTTTAAERATISWPQGIQDTGTNGLAINCLAGSGAASVYPSIATSDSVSVGVWVYVPIVVTNNHYLGIISIEVVGGGQGLVVACGNKSGVTVIRMFNTSNSDIPIAASNAWYWVTAKYTKSSACSLGVYDNSGASVGSTNITDGTGLQFDKIRCGQFGGYHDKENVSIYYDDFCIDLNARFPVGP